MDKEKAVKASQTANLLVQDLRDLVGSDNPLLSDVAMDLLEQAARLEARLARIALVVEEKPS